MAGMLTTNTASPSGYNSRMLEIEVTGVRRQDLMHTSNYTLKVSYSRLSQTIQNINRMGGKVASVTMASPSPNSEQ